MLTYTIRPELQTDSDAIRRLELAAFAPSEAEARLVDLLRANGQAIVALVAETATGEVVGQVLFSPVTVGGAPAKGLGLAPLAVLPAHQRRGAGAQLARAGLEACRAAGYDFAVVLGDPRYYARFGFQRARNFGLDNEYNEDEPFMAMELRPGGLEGVRGLVRYRPEFTEVGR